MVFINDLPEIVRSIVRIYADDTKIFREIVTHTDCEILQADLDLLIKWSEEWQLQFNIAKCKFLHIGRNSLHYNYSLDGTALEEVSEERDLGIIMDSELKFHTHVASAVLKASRVLAIIRRTFLIKDRDTIPKLFKGLVRPILEYGNAVWHPRHKADMKEIEKVQRRATKLIPSLAMLNYGDRLQALKLPSLQYRMRRGDMIQTYKIVHGIDWLDKDMFFSSFTIQATRGHPFKLFQKRSRLDVRANAFGARVVHDWNSLPNEVVSAPSVNSFKARLDKFWSEEWYCHPWE